MGCSPSGSTRSSGLPEDVPSDWPSLEEISAYNSRVRNSLDGVLEMPRKNCRMWP